MTVRQTIAAGIMANPECYKVCASCGSIARVVSRACPACNAYRWHESVEAVLAQAEILARREATAVLGEDLA